ncbi:MAG: putative serine/threonine protein phosphatase [Watsoniomyces obsoletus]|nr:MAG: putative serine/threonine protein phosphatase [Watsoniomyces obsoletus]
MVPKRALPAMRNPLLEASQTPEYEDLVSRRRLGQTESRAKGKPPVIIDFAHLRAPLPQDLHGAELFGDDAPDAYYLMRRSSDGYVSATGMFKAAFPRATQADEQTERKYLQELGTTSKNETAGNIWVPPTHALQLAEQYGISTWIRALLDPAPVEKVPADAKKHIAMPPPFHPLTDNPLFTALTTTPAAPPTGGRGRGRLRSSSPGRSPAKKTASPRKGRTTKASAAAAAAAAAALDHLPPGVHFEAPSESTGDNKPGLPTMEEENIHVDVDTAHQTNGDLETSYTNVRVELPPKMEDMKEPESPEEMIARAKEMVETAERMAGGSDGSSAITKSIMRKRKADELEIDEEDEKVNGITRPSKKSKTLERQLRQEKIKSRAWTGLSITLAIGAILPYVL